MRKLSMIIAAIAALCAGEASADPRFQVAPTRIDLSATAPAGALVITNHGGEPLRLQLSAYRWRDDIDGAAQLAPAPDILVRPSLVEIGPGNSRTIRVGTTAGPGEREASFRVFIEQLPDRRSVTGTRIQMLTRIGVPVFVAPKQTTRRLESTAVFVGARATVQVRNLGTQHVKLGAVRVVASRGDRVRWRHAVTGWYVLAGADRRFVVDLGTDACDPADHLNVELYDQDGAVVAAAPTRCEP